MEVVYTCPTCGATKTLKKAEHQSEGVFLQGLPPSLPCGVAGCTDKAVRPPAEFPVVDIRRKEIGKLVLTQEAVEILKQTGVDLIMRYNSRVTEVTAWLE